VIRAHGYASSPTLGLGRWAIGGLRALYDSGVLPLACHRRRRYRTPSRSATTGMNIVAAVARAGASLRGKSTVKLAMGKLIQATDRGHTTGIHAAADTAPRATYPRHVVERLPDRLKIVV